MTICGLAVLLIPAGLSRLDKEQGDPESTAAVAPSVLGWRQERSAEGLSFGDDAVLTYRGLQAPARSETHIAIELAKHGRTALVPLRIALSQHSATMSGVQRIVLHNLPSSAYVSAGRRAADGTWVIDDGGSRDVMIAVTAPLDDRLAIKIEGRGRDGLVWVHMITGTGKADVSRFPAPLASALGRKEPEKTPEVEPVRVAPAASALPPRPEVVLANPDAYSEGRSNATSATALQPAAAAQAESRPKAVRSRGAARPSQKSTADVTSAVTWRDGVFDKERN